MNKTKSMQITPEAIFDSLSIAHKLDNAIDGFTRDEIHLFAYFSAVLYSYSGNSISTWSYRFVISESGYPHSKDLSDAISRNILNGHFKEDDAFYIITGRGTDEFYRFSKFFPTYSRREKFIDAACSTSVIIPYKEAKEALLNNPKLKEARIVGNQEWLGVDYGQLKEVTEALGAPVGDLIIPAVTWVELLSNKNQED